MNYINFIYPIFKLEFNEKYMDIFFRKKKKTMCKARGYGDQILQSNLLNMKPSIEHESKNSKP